MLGIGITTFNRREQIAETVEHVRRFTEAPYRLIVADDGSDDGTREWLRAEGVPHIAGANRGVAWNKNRALYWLHAVAGCDPIIILEDDTFPLSAGWERDWIEGAVRYGHANLAGDWFSFWFKKGTGTPADPFYSRAATAQCSVFSREAMDAVGYMDTRFKRYGFEHAEHSFRLIRAGYGGDDGPDWGTERPAFFLLKSDLRVTHMGDLRDTEGLAANEHAYMEIKEDPTLYRAPWRTVEEEALLRAEVASAEVELPSA